MSCVYEEMADLMVASMSGAATGMSRDEFVALFKTRFPDEADFRAFLAQMRAHTAQLLGAMATAGAANDQGQAPAGSPANRSQ